MPDEAVSTPVPSTSPVPTPRPRTSVGLLILVGLICGGAGAAAGFFAARGSAHDHDGEREAAGIQYQCPMHPSIVQDHPGNCPICGMKLVKMEAVAPTGKEDDEPAAAPAVPGMATVKIDPERQQLIGLSTAEVAHATVGGRIRTVGHVGVDETRVRRINVKNQGFVERVFVDFIGKRVRKGDRLFTYYSPELLAAQEELLSTLRLRGPGESGQALLEAARRRLRLWDMPAAEIERLERTGVPSRTVTVYSPIAGVVTKKDVFEGMKLEAGAMPYEIVDLSAVWVLADVYESELSQMKEGLAGTLELKAFPNKTFEGKVVFVDPFLDPNTRTVRVRLTFPNASGELRPEMFGEVSLETSPRHGLTIPADAVIDSGTTKVVFVALADGKFQPREVELGQSSGSVVEVLGGLVAGERVVTRANFLIDSESRLRASLDALGSSADGPESARVLPPSGTDPHAGHR